MFGHGTRRPFFGGEFVGIITLGHRRTKDEVEDRCRATLSLDSALRTSRESPVFRPLPNVPRHRVNTCGR
jgi:hypothetical protein